MSTIGFVDSIGRDLRYALRGLARRPAFTFAAVLTLALGIGATTAIFSVVYSVLIKPLPYPNADELVRIRHSFRGELSGADFDATMYFTYRDENRTFANIGLWQDGSSTLTDRGEPERVSTLRVTDGTLEALAVQPIRGRWFTEQEHAGAAQGPAPVILSHAFWQRRFGGNAAAVGDRLTIDSQPAEVVGIMPPDFRFLDRTPQPDLIVAMRLDPAAARINGGVNYLGLARLKPGVTPAEARADATRMLSIWPDAWPIQPGIGLTRELIGTFQLAPVIRPLKDDVVGGVASVLWVLMGAIGAVLLVACANIANLMLVRADARRQEFVVRAALGAGAKRITRELLVESASIGAAGSVLGLVLAYLGLQALVAIGPSNLPRLQEIAIYLPVLAFTVAVSLAATLVFGSITALKAALHIGTPMTLGARGSTASRDRSATRNGLVVVQVALALVLVVSAALMIRTFQALRDIDPGFSAPATIQTARVWLPNTLASDPQTYTRIQHEILDKIAALPGVASAGFAGALPMESPPLRPPILLEGQTVGETPTTTRGVRFVSPGYFETMGTRIVAGRDITWSDIEAGGRVVVISEDFARELAPEPAGALGKRIRTYAATDAWREVVGVVQNVREAGLYENTSSVVYWPTLVENMYGSPVLGTPFAAFVIRSERAGAASLMDEVRQAVWAVNAALPITSERTMQDLYAGSLARTSFVLVMLAIAGGMALLLGVVGIYGVIAYVVSQRTREIGIRSALGAKPLEIKRMFLLHGLALSGVGVVIGGLVAAAVSRSMSGLLFGIEPLDPAAYLAAIGVIVAAAALASYLPARRAAAIDPIETLRAE
jgi:putative ABC transport system permease protein